MAKQTINIGSSPNDGTGTPLRTAFDYTNQNFTELYTATGPSGNNIVVPGSATITGDLTVRTNKLFVNATGVGVGTTSLFGDLNIQNGSNCRFELGSQAGGTVIENLNNARNAYLNMTMFADAYIWNRLGSEAMRLNSTGLGVGVVPSAGGGCLQLSSGITFPATAVASSDANTLDDYEEGSWTPTLNAGTFSAASCRYTKVGNMVTVFFDLTVGTGGGSQITNLPFTAASTSTVSSGIYTNNQTYAAGTTAPVVVIGGSSTTLFFRTVGSGVAFSAMSLTAGANLTGSISYFV